MFIRSLVAACAAVILCAAVVETADAYPITARAGATTVTGLYRPLDLQLTLVDGTNALTYVDGTGAFSFTAIFNGTFTGYSGLSGVAGNWRLDFGTGAFTNDEASDDGANVIYLAASNLAGAVGTLTYTGGGDYLANGIPAEDLPAVNDYFELFPTIAGNFLEVTCTDPVATCGAFTLQLIQKLQLLGPYIDLGGGAGYVLDTGATCDVADPNCIARPSRVNADCTLNTDGSRNPCGGVSRLSASSVPEPASLALVGLALSGLTWIRRRQRRN